MSMSTFFETRKNQAEESGRDYVHKIGWSNWATVRVCIYLVFTKVLGKSSPCLLCCYQVKCEPLNGSHQVPTPIWYKRDMYLHSRTKVMRAIVYDCHSRQCLATKWGRLDSAVRNLGPSCPSYQQQYRRVRRTAGIGFRTAEILSDLYFMTVCP